MVVSKRKKAYWVFCYVGSYELSKYEGGADQPTVEKQRHVAILKTIPFTS